MVPSEVQALLGSPDSVGFRDLLGKHTEVVWWYWRGIRLYGVVFNSDTNNRPIDVCDRYCLNRLSEGRLMPPCRSTPVRRRTANRTRHAIREGRVGRRCCEGKAAADSMSITDRSVKATA